MATIIVTMSLDPDQGDEVRRHLTDDVASWAPRLQGFLSGSWLCSSDGHTGVGVVRFASEEDAEAAATGPRSTPRQAGRAWNVEQVEVFTEVASA